jgi:drug/metabolite transporter (DMT)-like permease
LYAVISDLWFDDSWCRFMAGQPLGYAGIADYCWAYGYYLSVRTTTLGQATALFQSSAIFVTILAPFLLKEKVGVYRGTAVIFGLIGIFMITNPFSDTLSVGAFWGILSALAGAILVIALRKLGKSDIPITVALWHNGIGAVIYPLMLLVFLPAELYPLILSHDIGIFVMFGISASLVQFGFASAYRYGEATVLVPTRYLSVPASALIGWIFWQEDPKLIEILGMAIVVGSCIFISIREYRLGRASKTTEPFLHKG